MKISILLPYKENFTYDQAGAVSLFVSQTTKKSKFRNTIITYGNTSSSKYLDNNFQNIDYKKNFLQSTSKIYVQKFLNLKGVLESDIIEIHNRPNYINLIKKKFNNKIFLYFHNDPLSMDGSVSLNERIKLIEEVDIFFFNSIWTKNRFLLGMDGDKLQSNQFKVCYQSSDNVNINFNKKQKIITFIGKLNLVKGYDIFGKAITKVLDKHKDWKAIVIGDEKRENLKYNHSRLNQLGFKNNKFIIDLLKKVSISVVCSRWDEPFGRVSLESASRGCAIITSNRGGLPETTKFGITLKKLNSHELIKKINLLIENKSFLLKKQKENYKGFYLTHKFVSDIIDKERENYIVKSFSYKKNSVLKILHITNFNNRFDGRLHYNTSKRLNNGFVRLGHNVLTISDRDLVNIGKSYKDLNGSKYLQKVTINSIKNFKPNLVVLGHADAINLQTIDYIKSNDIKICQWFLDPIGIGTPDNLKNKRRLLDKSRYIDASFITTDPLSLNFKTKNTFFIPNPSDPSFEIHNNYEKNCHNDLFFAMSHGVHRGKLKEGKFDERELFLNKLIKKNQNIKFDVYGINSKQPIWAEEFMKMISNSSMALNLSRGKPVKYYSSDRIVQLMGNGLLTFIDKKTCYNDFFSKNEIITYNNINDLSYNIQKFKKDHKQRKIIAKNGKIKYMKYFNSEIVAQFIIEKTFGQKFSRKYLWIK